MSITFKEFSDILEKGQQATGGSGKFKSTAPKPSKVGAGKSKEGKLDQGIKTKGISGFKGGLFGGKKKKDKKIKISGFGKGLFGGKPKKDKKPKVTKPTGDTKKEPEKKKNPKENNKEVAE